MLTDRALNRTLLQRQHLLARTAVPPLALIEHLVGLQGQDMLPPYLSLWSRLEDFAPEQLTQRLEDRSVSRIVVMRGTIHVVSARDALGLRPLLQDTLERLMRGTPFVWHCEDIPREHLLAAADEALGAEPVGVKELGAALAKRFPGHEPGHLANTVRLLLPLVQTPPRGVWKSSGGPAYVHAEEWHTTPLRPLPAEEMVRRYLRAFGPATAADITTWSGMTGMRAVLARMEGELVRHTDEHGRTLVDLAGQPVASGEEPAPVRLLGKYDNLWLSHADRTRVAEQGKRRRWMGVNGGIGNTIFVDGMLEGLWRSRDGALELELFRDLTAAERRELDDEVARLEAFLAR